MELDAEVLTNVAKQVGFEVRPTIIRGILLTISLDRRRSAGPLLLFDAADPANLGWFLRCQFHIEGRTGAVVQTLGSQRDRSSRPLPNAVRLSLTKELPVSFRLPGKQQVSEQVVYALLHNLLVAANQDGRGGVRLGRHPAAGRTDRKRRRAQLGAEPVP